MNRLRSRPALFGSDEQADAAAFRPSEIFIMFRFVGLVSAFVFWAGGYIAKADCLACQCGGIPDIHPVESLTECQLGCASFGIICSDPGEDAVRTNKVLHVAPKAAASFRPFDLSCRPDVENGHGRITGQLPAGQCTISNEGKPKSHPGDGCYPGGLPRNGTAC